jgi:DHA1 family multidrug resistance protein-like MFS transporter
MKKLDSASWKGTLYASATAQFFCMIGASFGFPFLAYYVQELGVTDPESVKIWTGLIISATSYALAVFAPIWGMLSDRYSRKLMVLRSMGAVVVVMILMGFARSPGHLLILRIIQGCLTGTITANMALVAGIVPVERTGYALGLVHSGAFAGLVAGPAIGGFVADALGYREAFWIGAVFVAIAVFLIATFTRDAPPDKAAEKANRKKGSYLALLASGAFLVILLVQFQINFAGAIGLPLLPLYVQFFHGGMEGASTIVGLIRSAGAVASVVGAVFLGRIGDRYGHRKMLLFSSIAASVTILMFAFARDIVDLYVVRILLSLALAGITPSGHALLRQAVSASNIGKAFGVSQSFRALGGGMGPTAGGLIAAQYPGVKGIKMAFLVTGTLMMLVPLFILKFLKHRQAPDEE